MSDFWQNQRHYGVFGWYSTSRIKPNYWIFVRNPPAPFERKEWTDFRGIAIQLPAGFPNDKWVAEVTGVFLKCV